ncbi:MAG: zinc-ribbon domain-containing protein [Nitrospinaceae bacterium]|nr:zinc-ribbon domain-containing protein [Nitrospinaceae bacterium]
MKIICTHCQAGYQVDLPDIKPSGVKFKCAKCQQKFLVKPPGAEQAQENVSSQATAAAGATETLPEEGNSDMPNAAPVEEPTETSSESEETKATDMPEDEDVEDKEQPETTETDSSKSDTGDDELDDFLDDPLNEDEEEETQTDSTPEDEGEEDEVGAGEEYDDDYDDEEFEIAPKKKFGLPTTKTGKMIAVGCVAALLLTGGGLYFGWKTFAPEELLQMGKSDTEIPDELTPKPEEGTDVAEPESEEAPLEDSLEPEQKQEQEQSGAQKEEPASGKSRPTEVAGGQEDKESDLAKELAQSDTLKGAVEGGDDEGLLAALAPEETQVTLSTIMPVAFDATDIRVLSFDLLIETSDRPSAQVIREALPIYEKVTMNTVDQFLRNKFYNDILYVKEKLQRRLQNNFNKKIEGAGRVKKVKFTEFMIQ